MKKLILIILFAISGLIAPAQTPDWLWVKTARGTGSVVNSAITTDANGYVYVTGSFYNPTITFGNTTLTNASTGYNDDIFIVKYDASGNVLWAKSAGGSDNDVATCITTDVNGYVYVTGTFNSPTISFGTTTLTNAGMFVVKYNTSGAVIWAKGSGGSGSDCITTDVNGYVYVTGTFNSPTISFGSIILNNTSTNNTGDMFVVKYNSSGDVIWAKGSGGSGSNFEKRISADAYGNVYVTGLFYFPAIIFGSDTLTNNYINGYTCEMVIVKYDASGNVIWAQSIGWPQGGSTIGYCPISTDAKGNIYVTGYFSSPIIIFGNDTLINHSINYGGNGFVVKYDASGNVIWAQGSGGTGDDSNNSISIDNKGNVYVMGNFSSPAIIFGNDTLYNTPSGNFFVVKYDSSGNVIWAQNAGGTNYDEAACITTTADGYAYVAGKFFSPTIIFGSDTLTNSNSGYPVFFVAKIDNTFTNGVINELNSLDGISVYPNPSIGLIAVNLNGNGYLSVRVFDELGREVYNHPVNSQEQNKKLNIAINNSSNGIYFIQVLTNEGIISKEIVIQK